MCSNVIYIRSVHCLFTRIDVAAYFQDCPHFVINDPTLGQQQTYIIV